MMKQTKPLLMMTCETKRQFILTYIPEIGKNFRWSLFFLMHSSLTYLCKGYLSVSVGLFFCVDALNCFALSDKSPAEIAVNGLSIGSRAWEMTVKEAGNRFHCRVISAHRFLPYFNDFNIKSISFVSLSCHSGQWHWFFTRDRYL